MALTRRDLLEVLTIGGLSALVGCVRQPYCRTLNADITICENNDMLPTEAPVYGLTLGMQEDGERKLFNSLESGPIEEAWLFCEPEGKGSYWLDIGHDQHPHTTKLNYALAVAMLAGMQHGYHPESSKAACTFYHTHPMTGLDGIKADELPVRAIPSSNDILVHMGLERFLVDELPQLLDSNSDVAEKYPAIRNLRIELKPSRVIANGVGTFAYYADYRLEQMFDTDPDATFRKVEQQLALAIREGRAARDVYTAIDVLGEIGFLVAYFPKKEDR